jgi:hypothetical protein
MIKHTLILEDAILRTFSLFGKTMNPNEQMLTFVTKAMFRVILVTFINAYIVYDKVELYLS